MSVFPLKTKSHLDANLFFDGGVSISRYDKVRYPIIANFTDQQESYFWRPQEIDLTRDSADFKSLAPTEQHIFTSNIFRQILLDSVQGRAPCAAFGPIVSNPELETWLSCWQFFENIHNKSYTHIISNIYSSPSAQFDAIGGIKEIIDCAKDISKHYDYLIEFNCARVLTGGRSDANTHFDHKAHKEALWMALMSVAALEGIRFYVSFACSWAFAEMKKMEGNAKIIKFIARDENIHLGLVQTVLKILPKEDPEFAAIRDRLAPSASQMYQQVAEQEIGWAQYLFRDGAMIGLNAEVLTQFIQFITNRRLAAVGLPKIYDITTDPLPWTKKWIGGSEVQVAPQETQVQSYIVGAARQDVTADVLKGFSL